MLASGRWFHSLADHVIGWFAQISSVSGIPVENVEFAKVSAVFFCLFVFYFVLFVCFWWFLLVFGGCFCLFALGFFQVLLCAGLHLCGCISQ